MRYLFFNCVNRITGVVFIDTSHKKSGGRAISIDFGSRIFDFDEEKGEKIE